MRRLDLACLPSGSAGATVARSSGVPPQYLVAADGGGLAAARWQRHHAALQQPQCLDEHLLAYCLTGRCEGTVVLDGVPRHVPQRAGSLTFIPAGRPVRWTMEAVAGCAHLHLYVPAATLQPCGPLPALLRDDWLDGYFRLLRAEVEGDGGAGIARSAFLDDTAGLVQRRLQLLLQTRPSQPAAGTAVSPLRPHLLRRIETYVHDHPGGDVRVPTLAGVVAMSPGHFLRAFRRATGSTPHQYVLARRLDRACELLLTGGGPVADIARDCGFCSAAHFTTLFHRHRGCTPTEFRRLH
jgi:AraC family transcriptional regulator